MAANSVTLVSMPWAPLGTPSIQLGILQALLCADGIASATHHAYLDLVEHLRRQGVHLPREVLEGLGSAFGDWMFARSLDAEVASETEKQVEESLVRLFGQGQLASARLIRDQIPSYLEACARTILDSRPSVVGFSTSYQQNASSLALARILKRRSPETRIVFGGSNCIGPTGRALMRSYSCIDAMVHGGAEAVASPLIQRLLDRSDTSGLQGVSWRDNAGNLVLASADSPAFPLEDSPLPDYSEYMARVASSDLGSMVGPVWLPYEASRGCWWGDVSTCTFCSATAGQPSYRSKTPARVLSDLELLVARYGCRRFLLTDNIMDRSYPRDLFPLIRARGLDYSFFLEVKATLTREELAAMRDGGAMIIQPGIESLSTPILRLIRKGTTAFQNIRFLKWATELQLLVFWNLLYGLPGEPPSEYEIMAELLPSLFHLQPPNPPIPLRLDRYAPYFAEAARHGIVVAGPSRMARATHGAHPNLSELAAHFEFSYANGAQPVAYSAAMRDACKRWRDAWSHRPPRLYYRATGGVVEVVDTRSGRPCLHRLDELDAAILAACEDGDTRAGIKEALACAPGLSEADFSERVAALLGARLVYAEGGRLLSLVLREAPPANRSLGSASVDR